MILAEGARLAVAGVAAGAVLALVSARALGSLLFGVSPADVPTLVAAALLLAGVAVAASYVPARSAARTDPMGGATRGVGLVGHTGLVGQMGGIRVARRLDGELVVPATEA